MPLTLKRAYTGEWIFGVAEVPGRVVRALFRGDGGRSISDTRKGGYTLVTLPRIVTPYRNSVDGTRARVTYQKLVTR